MIKIIEKIKMDKKKNAHFSENDDIKSQLYIFCGICPVY